MKLLILIVTMVVVQAAPPRIRDEPTRTDCSLNWGGAHGSTGVCACPSSAHCATCDPNTHTLLLAASANETILLPALLAPLPNIKNVTITGATVVFEGNTSFHSAIEELTVVCGSVTTLGSNALSWAGNLKALGVMRSSLNDLSPDALTGLISLETLDLSDNELTRLPHSFLTPVRALKRLVLDGNSIKKLSKAVFSVLRNCEVSVERNNLTTIEAGAFYGCYLTKLSLAHNQLRHISDFHDEFLNLLGLRELSLAWNFLQRVPTYFACSPWLTKLDLRWNNITDLQTNELYYCKLTSHAELDLRHNHITTVALTEGALLPRLRLEHNPLRCDAALLPLAALLCAPARGSGGLVCAHPPALSGRSLCSVPREAFVDHLPCEPCACTRAPDELRLLCDTPPPTLPAALAPRPSARVVLRLTRPPPAAAELVVPPGITEFSLAGLDLVALPPLRLPASLRRLDLTGNRLANLTFEPLPGLEVSLAGNELECSCPQLSALREAEGRVLDLELVRCQSGLAPRAVRAARCATREGAALAWWAAAALGAGALAAAGAAVRRPTVWLAATGRRPAPKPGPALRYTVFLSAESGDAGWVSRAVLPRLERELGSALCVGLRAYEPGELVSAQATMLVAQARVTVAVVTPAYLDSVPARLELAAASERGSLLVVLVGVSRKEVPLPLGAAVLRWGAPLFWRRLWARVPASPPPVAPRTVDKY